MTLLEEFYHFHRCDKPTSPKVMDKWGVVTCLHCGFGVVLEPWPGKGKETKVEQRRKPRQAPQYQSFWPKDYNPRDEARRGEKE